MKEKVKLSKRLITIANFISKGAYFADIGSDHGYLACYVCQNDPSAKAIASEVSNGPFLRTKETIEHYRLTERIEARLGNGLTVLEENDPVNEIVIAGMGGALITQILEEGRDKLLNINKIIAQPNNNEDRVRKFFLDNGYHLVHEVILEENNQIYEILVAERKGISLYLADENLEKQLFFGPLLMKEKSEVFRKKWQAEKEKIEKILTQIENRDVDHDKIRSFQRKLSWIEEVLT